MTQQDLILKTNSKIQYDYNSKIFVPSFGLHNTGRNVDGSGNYLGSGFEFYEGIYTSTNIDWLISP
jgi:hypothetical protein